MGVLTIRLHFANAKGLNPKNTAAPPGAVHAARAALQFHCGRRNRRRQCNDGFRPDPRLSGAGDEVSPQLPIDFDTFPLFRKPHLVSMHDEVRIIREPLPHPFRQPIF